VENISALKEKHKRERDRANQAVKIMREDHEHNRSIAEALYERHKEDIMNKHRKFHARKVIALGSSAPVEYSRPTTALNTLTFNYYSREPRDLLGGNEEDFASAFLKNSKIDDVKRTIDMSTRGKLPPIGHSKRVPFLQLLQKF